MERRRRCVHVVDEGQRCGGGLGGGHPVWCGGVQGGARAERRWAREGPPAVGVLAALRCGPLRWGARTGEQTGVLPVRSCGGEDAASPLRGVSCRRGRYGTARHGMVRYHSSLAASRHRQPHHHYSHPPMPATPATPAPTPTFQPQRSLLNPHFQGYRLTTAPHAYRSTAHPLPSSISLPQLSPSPSAPSLAFKEAKDRLTHHRLLPGSLPGHLAYVDDAAFLVLIVLSAGSERPSFHPLSNLSPPEPSSSRRPPSIHPLPHGKWLAADGVGTLTLLQSRQQGPGWTADVAGVFTLPQPRRSAFRILHASQGVQDGLLHVLVQSLREEAAPTPRHQSKRVQPSSRTLFDVSLLTLPPTQADKDDRQPSLARVQWTLSGEDGAYYATLDDSAEATLVGEEPFAIQHKGESSPAPSRLPVATPVHPNSPQSTTARPAPPTPAPTYPPPFSWLQTSDSLTVVFQLPPSLTKKHFRVLFSPQGLSLSLTTSALDVISPQEARSVELADKQDGLAQLDGIDSPEVRMAKAIDDGRYRFRALWSPIDPASSLWTWEHVGRDERKKKGILTLYLEKKDEGTRWLRVFERAAGSPKRRRPKIGTAGSDLIGDNTVRLRKAEEVAEEQAQGEHDVIDVNNEDEDDEDPPETLDPSELLTMVISLDKYTAPEGGAFDDDPVPRIDGFEVGSGKRESLLRDQMEPEDAVVGRKLRLTTVSRAHRERHEPSIDTHPDTEGLWALAGPLLEREIIESSSSALPLVVRKDLDGLVFIPSQPEKKREELPQERSWKHVDTLPALSFVLASKRDLHRVYIRYCPRQTSASASRRYHSLVLAFESPPQTRSTSSSSSNGHAGNLFVYYGQKLARLGPGGEVGDSKGNFASSQVIRLDVGEQGQGERESEGSGALVGVAAVNLPSPGETEVEGGEGHKREGGEEEILACLCERNLILLRGVL